jgi:sigma-B regulation protein RsbU (phosphoserine phosphatase)
MIVIYSDGVTEATDPKYEEFGEDRFIEVLRAHRTEPAAKIVDEVTQALAAWSAGSPPADDVTLIVAKRVG